MLSYAAPRERRLDRRIPVNCAAFIQARDGNKYEAECIELSVAGMTLRADYVPGEGEVVDVAISSPNDQVERPPLMTRLRVTRCHPVSDGRYEIGGAIVRVVG